jgi:hypothetical protein
LSIRRIPEDAAKAPPKKTKKPKKAKRETESRIGAANRRRQVERLYLRGRTVDEIVETIAKAFPRSANSRNVTNDIFLIRKRWRDQAKQIFDNDPSAWFVRTALNDRQRALKDGDLKLAYAIAKDIAKLAGVDLTDFAVEHRAKAEERVMTWLELMAAERQRKNLPPADFQVFDPLRLPAPAEKP